MSSTVSLVALELAGMGELVRMLGVSRTRAVQLSSGDDFPAPLAELSMGKVWDVAEIRHWADRRGRALLPLDAGSSGGA